ncbi:MAG: biotin--[acetyl-CoA-carboxylase] ligase, partial [Oscillospiraceae bacterium]
IRADKSVYITTSAAGAVSKPNEKVSDKCAKIKWVNDIFCDNKKVCGILTEASLNVENGGLDFAVLGIGVNIKPPDGGFPEEIRDVAGAIFDAEPQLLDARSILIAEILDEFWGYYTRIEDKTFLEEYKNRSILLGKKITVIKGNSRQDATALSIDDDCRLKVKYNDNSVETLFSGEVSIKI